jgi:hypothetical protein
VSISSTFFVRLFRTKVFYAAFINLQFGFVIFCRKNIGSKVASKMLMRLTVDYDVGNFLAAVGGNLGLLLGLSGLSVLFYLIKWLKRYQK